MIEAIAALSFILSGAYNGVDLSIGMGAQSKESTPQPYRMKTPLGTLRLETKPHQNFRLYAQHISSIPDTHDYAGLNIIGAEFTVHIGGRRGSHAAD